MWSAELKTLLIRSTLKNYTGARFPLIFIYLSHVYDLLKSNTDRNR